MSTDVSKLIEFAEQSQNENKELKDLVTRLLSSIGQQNGHNDGGGAGAGNLNLNQPNAADIRREKISKLYINLKKS